VLHRKVCHLLDPGDDVPPEPAGGRLREGRHDDLVDALLVDGVERGRDGVRVPDVAARLDSRLPEDGEGALQTPLDARLVSGRHERELGRRGPGPLADGLEQRAADDGLIRDHEDVGALPRRREVDLDVRERHVRDLASPVDEPRPQPARAHGPRVGRDDDLVHRGVRVQRVAERLQRVRIDDGAARSDARLVQEVERASEAPLGGRAAALLVDDEACPRIVLRTDDRDADRPLGDALAKCIDQAAARNGLVRDDEHVPRPGRRRRPRGLLVRVLAHRGFSLIGPIPGR
jgi:hypothetical protein